MAMNSNRKNAFGALLANYVLIKLSQNFTRRGDAREELLARTAALALLVFVARAARRWRRYVVESGGDAAASAEFQMYATLLLILLSAAGVAWSSLAAFLIVPCETLR